MSPGSKRKAGHLEAGLERRAGDGIVEVPLTQGKVAIVDAQDAERVLCHKWYAQRNYTSSHDLWYAVTSIQKGGGTQILLSLHRFILQLPPRIPQVDHRDCDGLNNRRSNLRLASNSQNAQNSRISSYNTSRYKGVDWDKKQGCGEPALRLTNEIGISDAFKTSKKRRLLMIMRLASFLENSRIQTVSNLSCGGANGTPG